MTDDGPAGRSPARRLGRFLLDTFAMGGTARAGVDVGGKYGGLLQTRPVMDAMLSTTNFEAEQSERQRAVWSTIGAFLLGALGGAMLVHAMPLGAAPWIGIGAVELAIAMLVLKSVVQRQTRSGRWHVAGTAALALAAFVSIIASAPLFGDWQFALPALAASIAAGVCLMIGRRD